MIRAFQTVQLHGLPPSEICLLYTSGVFFQGATDGIRLFKADGSHIMTFTDDIAGCQLTENNDLKLTISFEFLNNDGTNTDLKIGVFFNGNLYQNEYITCTGFNTADLKQLIKLYVKNSALTVASVSTPVPAYLDDYTTTTIGLSYGCLLYTSRCV